jgi:hypothetical protein
MRVTKFFNKRQNIVQRTVVLVEDPELPFGGFFRLQKPNVNMDRLNVKSHYTYQN